ncbi:MAG TPA: glycosyltransferase [Ktedonobacterales bacterium]|nr:glycosyltransferase [Ktedonobacterales bacterium]
MSRRARQKRRFLFSFTGGPGHFHPLASLAHALEQAGHDVAFAVGAGMRPRVESAGFVVFPLGGNFAADPEYRQVKAQLRGMPAGLDAELFTYTRIFCGIAPRLRTPELVAIARAWRPDMLIREAGEYGAVIAAEHLGLPHAVVAFAAALQTMTHFEREAAAQLDPIRQSWSLAPDPTLASLYRYLYLAYSPPSFGLCDVSPVAGRPAAEPQPVSAIPPTTHFIRPQIFDNPEDERLPDWVAELPARPTIYVTLGTELAREPEFYPSVLQTIIAGLRDAPINLIVTVGRENDPAEFGPQPANVRIERYVPQSLLLPHCDLIVMHGGSNSLLAALDMRVPMVVIPLIADQFFNAHILQDMRLGLVVPHAQLTPASIRAAVDNVLANPLYREKVRQLQAEMHALPGQHYAVELIQRVAVERTPIPGA